ncbi:MAG: hybrid sensor histidine kinase/response regulator [Candidatus Krumholzibacteriia bacterium]
MPAPEPRPGIPDRHDTTLGAVHDANQMLGVILGRAELLLSEDPGPRWRDGLQQIVRAARDAEAILAAALDTSERAGTSPAEAPAALAAVLAEVWRMAMVHPRSGRRAAERLTLRARVPGELVAAAPARAVQEILLNLVLNACEAMATGGALTVAAVRTADRILLEIRDEGPGLDDDARAGLFRIGAGGAPRGHGIGLAHARELARRHGGDLVLAEARNPGAVFRLELPAAAPDAVVGARRDPREVTRTEVGHAATARRGRPEPASGGRLSFLVVDDEPTVRELVAELLGADGHVAITARDGQSARRSLERDRPSAALIDLGLPGEDGVAVARSLKQMDPHLVVVLVSGWGSERTAAAAAAEIVDLTATKPLDLDRLRTIAAAVAERRTAGEETPPASSHRTDGVAAGTGRPAPERSEGEGA